MEEDRMRLRHPVAPALFATIALLVGIQPAVAGTVPTVGPNLNVSRMPENQAETTIAINPTNPDNIAMASNTEGGYALFEAYSFDGGATWHPQLVADGDDDLGFACCDPSMAFDQFGNLFLVYLDRSAHGGNVKSTQIALSTDGGATSGSSRALSSATSTRSARRTRRAALQSTSRPWPPAIARCG
jgi:hypothetical protein